MRRRASGWLSIRRKRRPTHRRTRRTSRAPIFTSERRSTARRGASSDGTTWRRGGEGESIRPYGEWQRPFRAGATPYGPWGNPSGPWTTPFGSWDNPYGLGRLPTPPWSPWYPPTGYPPAGYPDAGYYPGGGYPGGGYPEPYLNYGNGAYGRGPGEGRAPRPRGQREEGHRPSREEDDLGMPSVGRG